MFLISSSFRPLPFPLLSGPGEPGGPIGPLSPSLPESPGKPYEKLVSLCYIIVNEVVVRQSHYIREDLVDKRPDTRLHKDYHLVADSDKQEPHNFPENVLM